jgi:hypothetical protein
VLALSAFLFLFDGLHKEEDVAVHVIGWQVVCSTRMAGVVDVIYVSIVLDMWAMKGWEN